MVQGAFVINEGCGKGSSGLGFAFGQCREMKVRPWPNPAGKPCSGYWLALFYFSSSSNQRTACCKMRINGKCSIIMPEIDHVRHHSNAYLGIKTIIMLCVVVSNSVRNTCF